MTQKLSLPAHLEIEAKSKSLVLRTKIEPFKFPDFEEGQKEEIASILGVKENE